MKWLVTSNKVSSSPACSFLLASCLPNWRKVAELAVGSAGMTARCSASTRALNNAMKPKAQRHPATSPICAPSGTPSTEAAATPPKIIDVARPVERAGTSRPARPPAMAQIPPMQKPTSTRAASIDAMFCANAEAILAITNSVSKAHRILRRSRLPDTITTNGANKAASKAGSEIIRPALPVEVSSVSAIGVSRPTGSISVVTTEKVAMPAAVTASQGWRTEGSAAARDKVVMACSFFQ